MIEWSLFILKPKQKDLILNSTAVSDNTQRYQQKKGFYEEFLFAVAN